MRVRLVGTVAVAVMAIATAGACGTDASGVGACRQVMETSCRQAPACGISLRPPYHTAGTDVEACIRFYDDACLHGLDVNDPGPASVQACVNAIQSTKDCGVVAKPQTDPSCAWLVPPVAPPSDASDAPPDAGDASSGD
jgi:hypothetical protein